MSDQSSNLHIAIISSGFYTGGFTSSLFAMSKSLLKQGVSIDYYLFNINTAEKFELKNEYPELVTVHEIQRINSTGNQLKYKLMQAKPESMKYRRMDAMALKQSSLLNQVRAYYNDIDLTQYDAVISWEELTCDYYLAEKVKARKKIGYIHPDYRTAGYHEEIDLPVYTKLDHLICVSEHASENLKQVFPELANRIVAIPNLLDTDRIDKLVKEQPDDLYPKSNFDIVTVCRLENRSKALDRAILITKVLDDQGLVFNWYVIGDGPDQSLLKEQITEAGIGNFYLLGQRDNPYPYMKQADLFVLQSNYEGKPVAVEEALYLGVPVLITNYASASEQIVDDQSGWIVNNTESAISEKLQLLISYSERVEHLKEAIIHSHNPKPVQNETLLKLIKS